MTTQREAWLDALRGVTISLVILGHCIDASSVLLDRAGFELPNLVTIVNNILRQVRMPAFFLCSGILFAVAGKRGWSWFVSKRLLWTTWIAALWGWLAVIVIAIGVNLYPLHGIESINLWQILLIDPIGNMWFIYAIAIAGGFCMVVRTVNPLTAILLAFIMSVAILFSIQHMEIPSGIKLTLYNLGLRGLLFFTIGFVFSKRLMRPRRGQAVGFIFALIIWVGAYYLLRKYGGGTFVRMAMSFPATFAAIYALQYLLARMPAIANAFGFLGKRSLELFLLHQFFIAAAFVALQPLVGQSSGWVILVLMFVAALALSNAAAVVLRLLPDNAAFAVPPRLLFATREQLLRIKWPT